MDKKSLVMVSDILLIIGGLDLGLLGLFKTDFITKILGFSPLLPLALYVIIGIAALYKIYDLFLEK